MRRVWSRHRPAVTAIGYVRARICAALTVSWKPGRTARVTTGSTHRRPLTAQWCRSRTTRRRAGDPDHRRARRHRTEYPVGPAPADCPQIARPRAHPEPPTAPTEGWHSRKTPYRARYEARRL